MAAEPKSNPPKIRRLHPWQFGLGGLMMLLLSIGVCLALVRWWGITGFFVFMVFAAPIWLRRRGASADLLVLKFLVAYGVVSVLTLPFLDALWLGELPLLAVFQQPKVELAHYLRRFMVMDVMGPFGLSRGSFSPDYAMARPYALAIAYLIPLGVLLPVLWVRTRLLPPYGVWTCALIVIAIADFCLTLLLAGGPGFTIY